ncbi:MAG TPA: hypothetical protein VHT75_15645 [Acidimicrobiales bacterium]|jgi:hypothetical protein|nr:hypothetical protein [Acidimicrobiales bacterium]
MKRSSLRGKIGLAAVLGFGALLIPAAVAWACLPVANLKTNLATIQAGQPVNVTGSEFGSNPVQIHLNALTGPVLATFTPDSNGAFTGPVTIPADTQAGPAVLVATEAAATATGNGGSSPGVPTRTVVQVVGPGGSAPLAVPAGGQGRPAGVVTSSSAVSTGALLLVGLGVFGIALFLAGGVALVTSGRRRQTEAERVRS